MIPISKFFTYLTRKDKVLMWIGTISSLIGGAVLPCMAIAMGEVTNSFDPRKSKEEALD